MTDMTLAEALAVINFVTMGGRDKIDNPALEPAYNRAIIIFTDGINGCCPK